jgi:integrase
MNRAICDTLSGLKGARTGLVFTKRGGGAWGNVLTAFEGTCRDAGVEDFRFHDLRHTCASWLVMRGRTLKEVQEILGHREFSMTIR